MVALLAGLLAIGSSCAAADAPAVSSVVPYGYVKLDAAWDDSRVDSGNYAKWVNAEDVNKNDSQFSMTANETRLGLKVTGPEFGRMKTRAQVEGDFYGGGAENKSNPMLRHAYAEVSWPAWDLAVLGGQTADVIGALNPRVLNYTVFWWAGNLGYRRPQLRVTKGLTIGDNRVEFTAAAVRTISTSAIWFTGDPGADNGSPTGEGRIALTVPTWTKQKATVGVSGHFGQEEWDASKAGNPRYFRSWSGGVDLVLPVLETLSLQGEGWMGENLGAYLGGIGQSFNFSKLKGIRAKGGWVSLNAGPYKFWKVTVGTSVDDPDDDDLSAAADKTLNQAAFASVTYDITPASTVGIEISDWMTSYKELKKNAEAARVQMSLIHRF